MTGAHLRMPRSVRVCIVRGVLPETCGLLLALARMWHASPSRLQGRRYSYVSQLRRAFAPAELQMSWPLPL